ncbi:MAG: cation diffusion facilitator family transporter [Solirubrobacteraceae bacterium]
MPNQTRQDEQTRLVVALGLTLGFMAVEVTAGVLSSSLALLSDAAHMLTDAAALALALLAARLATRPARGVMTFGLGRAEILSAEFNGVTLLLLALLIVYGAIRRLISPPAVDGEPVLIVALVGIIVNLTITRVLGEHGHQHGHTDHQHAPSHPKVEPHMQPPEQSVGIHNEHRRSLNVEASYQHIVTDLFGFIATAAAATVILTTGFRRADAVASLLIAAVMLRACFGVLRASVRVMMEAAPVGVIPEEIGRALVSQPNVVEVHDLHVWEVTSGFYSISAHVVVNAGSDCHATRRSLARMLAQEFGLPHSTLQVEHAMANQPPMQINSSATAVHRPAAQLDEGGLSGQKSPDQTEGSLIPEPSGRFR